MNRFRCAWLGAGIALLLAAMAAQAAAQDKPPLKLGGILDMSGLYADITGPGSETAAKMAAEDFGGEVLGRKIEIIAADHLNKADLSANIARDMLDNQGVEMIYRRRGLGHRARRRRDREGAQQDHHVQRPGLDPAQQRGLRALYRALRVRHLRAGQRHRARRGQAGPRHLVLPHRRLRLRRGPGKGHHQRGAEVRRQGAGQRQASAQHLGFLVLSCCRRRASKAKVIGLANAGGDTINAIKQGAEFGIMKGGQKMSPLLAFVTDIDSVGLETAQGLLLAEAFYWDLNDDTRAFSKRFMERVKRVPTSAQAGVYSSVTHYLKAVKAAGTTDAAAVMKVMKATPINDFFARNGRIREDGRMVHDMYLFEVKKPAGIQGPLGRLQAAGDRSRRRGVPAAVELSRCPLVKK